MLGKSCDTCGRRASWRWLVAWAVWFVGLYMWYWGASHRHILSGADGRPVFPEDDSLPCLLAILGFFWSVCWLVNIVWELGYKFIDAVEER